MSLVCDKDISAQRPEAGGKHGLSPRPRLCGRVVQRQGAGGRVHRVREGGAPDGNVSPDGEELAAQAGKRRGQDQAAAPGD